MIGELKIDDLAVEIYPDRKSMGEAAAEMVSAQEVRQAAKSPAHPHTG